MNKKLLLMMSLLLIIFGLYGLAGNIAQKLENNQSNLQANVNEATYLVWTLNQDVKKGQIVDRSQFDLQTLTESEAFSKGVSNEFSLDFIPNSAYTKDISVSSIIFPEFLKAPNQDGYAELVVAKNRVPFAIRVESGSVVGGIITAGSVVDVIAISTPNTLLVETESNRNYSISVTPIVMAVKVLQVEKIKLAATNLDTFDAVEEAFDVNIVVELTRKQVSKLTIAKEISKLEVQKSIGDYEKSDLQADASDVLPGFKSIVEFRANGITIN